MTASKHERTKGQTNHIAEAIALLDEIDGMAFGKVDAALNALSGKLLLAQAEHDALVEALEFYADEKNWMAHSKLDMESGHFDGWTKAKLALSLAKTEG